MIDRAILADRLRSQDILSVSAKCAGMEYGVFQQGLYPFIFDVDDRVGYNALWIFTHLSSKDKAWLAPRRNELIELLFSTEHTGKRRLLLNLLECISITENDVRTDYLDYCLSKINSTEPYAVRAFCLKQAFAQCRFFPELMDELCSEMELMQYGTLSPGLRSVLRNIRKKMAKL